MIPEMNIPSDAQRLMTDVEQIFDRAKHSMTH